MSEAEKVVESGTSGGQSAEEKFFGVRTTIGQQAESKSAEKPEFDIEVVDDRPPEDRPFPRAKQSSSDEADVNVDDKELEGYSKKVQKRIDKLRYAQHEERRQKEEAERMREEAVKVAQQLAGKNREYEALIQRGEGALITQVKERAKLALEKAKSSYRKAYEEGNTDNVVDAQGSMVQAQTELNEVEQYERSLPDPSQLEQQQAAYQQQQQAAYQQQQAAYQQQQQQAAQQAPQLDAKQAAWAEDNPWFGNPEEKLMSATAYGLHEQALQDHNMDPSTDEYYDYINTGMRKQFPDYSWSDESGTGNSATATTKRATSVVAPSARSNGARPRKVRLTSTQVSLAKRLGLTNDQYARQLAKEMANG
jgi:hypothetical protein